MRVAPGTTKERIVLTAERLFAEHGVDGVSLRYIGSVAGSANNSAVLYHFGTKDQLVQAVFEYRLPSLTARRNELIAARSDDRLRPWIACQVRTVLEQGEMPGSHYMGFITSFERLRSNPLDRAPDHLREDALGYQQRLRNLLVHLHEPLRSHRLRQAMSVIIRTGAARERALGWSQPVLPLEVEFANVLDGTVGMLEAPASPQALTAVCDADPLAVAPDMYM
jgi:AcrR family transcriptional regulator